ncbi:GNAT family N-acetyltransferase [Clostridium sardiniense]|uniref:GNAT family N-acetyltransferase n=1 Tax=Clostridium sardiniense TaxID=29369 RepID=A0ABS7KT85_CLOSR|nr:GNAT family N-acetyltransferase [Clostridium sardiniense]MBY0754028.1 GNAT family N-acetyltransferase [Clostridium sardiniense]MDQ0459455.1 ribosomal protein S18 acetylase RimI-like enzyme [Clostridium sardiniense]
MMIEKTNILSDEQIKDIKALEDIVFKEENLKNNAFLSNEINFDKTVPCFYMAYEKDELVAFLNTFIPSPSEGEVIVFTHPKFRRKGYFKALFQCAKEELLKAGIEKVLLAIEPKSKSGFAVLGRFNEAKWEHSEYKMAHDGVEGIPKYSHLNFIELDNSNREIYVGINLESFSNLEYNPNFIDTIIDSESRKGYIAYENEIPIGAFALKYDKEEAYIYNVGINSKYRGRGFGKELMGYAIKVGLAKCDKAVLDVDSSNPIALNLYKKCGFKTDCQVDYYDYKLI